MPRCLDACLRMRLQWWQHQVLLWPARAQGSVKGMVLELPLPLTSGCTAQAPQDAGAGQELARTHEALAAALARCAALEHQVQQRDTEAEETARLLEAERADAESARAEAAAAKAEVRHLSCVCLIRRLLSLPPVHVNRGPLAACPASAGALAGDVLHTLTACVARLRFCSHVQNLRSQQHSWNSLQVV